MNKCPICGKDLFIKQWYDDGRLSEWLMQCAKCKYMKHWFHGSVELVLGNWRKIIRTHPLPSKRQQKKNDSILNEFNLEIKNKKTMRKIMQELRK